MPGQAEMKARHQWRGVTHLAWGAVLLASSAPVESWAVDTPAAPVPGATDRSFIESYPSLKKFVFEEPPSKFSIGFGVVPLGILRDKFYVGLNLFQVHWTTSWLDWQFLNASVGFGMTSQTEAKSMHFIARTAPLIRFTEVVSIGPLLGIEYVEFSNQPAKIRQDVSFSAKQSDPEPFSSSGLIYGVMLAQSFKLASGSTIRIAQSAFMQNYSTNKAGRDGWIYNFNGESAQSPIYTPAPDAVEPAMAFLLELSITY